MSLLFWRKNAYDWDKTEDVFMSKLQKNWSFQYENCEEYRELMGHFQVTDETIRNLKDYREIPWIPTLYLKHHTFLSVPEKKLMTKATSSGTSGNKSVIGYDFQTMWSALGMVLSIGRKHHLWSLKPCHYVVLGYEHRGFLWGSPKIEEKAVAKTAYGFTFFAPALSRTYALKYKDGDYVLNLEDIRNKLLKYSKGKTPVRIMGFPFHAYWMLNQMKEEGIKCPLPKGSMIAFGGGWKQYYTEQPDKQAMYRLIEEILDIPEENCREFFGAVEHPILYCDCPKHHFHVPNYARVVIRDVDTMEPVENGTTGLVNLITPLIHSAPLLSVMTDDLGILHDAKECGCGIDTPYLEILGRVGMEDITTCAAGAEKLIQGLLSEETK